MSLLQFAASDPNHSVWVGASAGTGKTKVLTDRVLRLLLKGVSVSKLLCLTFTNAAAAEMANRINAQLSSWATMEEAKLIARLTELTGIQPDTTQLTRARQLFAEVLDAPEGLKIQTIHSFCQALLKQFPLEAGISPHTALIDEHTASELLATARLRLLQHASTSHDSHSLELADSLASVAWQLHESSLNTIVGEVTSNRAKFEALLSRHQGLDGLIAAVYQALDVQITSSEESLQTAFCDETTFDYKGLLMCCHALLAGTATEKKQGEIMAAWLAASQEERIRLLPDYMRVFLTQDLIPRSKILNNATLEAHPAAEEIIQVEQRRLLAYCAQHAAVKTATLTHHLLVLSHALFTEYQALKAARSFMDFNDLILTAMRLLENQDLSDWILYKQEGGIDHILVDEAQDTSPEQWQIARGLCSRFFHDEDDRHKDRTVFVVGDEKQSIFSFQGADPLNFNRMHYFFKQHTEQAQKGFRSITLDKSFRSTSAVLGVVDKIFSHETHHQAVCSSGEAIIHNPHRAGQAGRVELWPPICPPKEEEEATPWDMPTRPRREHNTQKILAELIADTISGWLKEKRLLPAKGRPLHAGDILILVRRRKEFSHYLVTALKKRQIPVAGADRITVTANLAVMDMMALGRFLLLPADDLTLATVLKTPLFAFSEEELFTLAYGRGKMSLWERLKTHKDHSPHIRYAYDYLAALLPLSATLSPFALYTHILDIEQGRARLIGRMGEEIADALAEFLSLAQNYEQAHAPSLQGFLHWLETSNTEIKRDMEGGKEQVRIMTVHGSKGLQAPIVFLPDTTQTPSNSKNLLWNEELVLWPAAGKNVPPFVAMLKEKQKQKAQEEYIRLLYVGLTRAEDEMVICGWQGKKALSDDCWYSIVRAALLDIAAEQPFTVPESLHYSLPDTVPPVALIVEHPQEVAAPTSTIATIAATPPPPLPVCLKQAATPEAMPPSPLMPSLLITEEEDSRSPLIQHTHHRYERGILIHTLLEFLPSVPPEAREEALHRFLARYADGFHPTARKEIGQQVYSLLHHPAFAPVFGPDSRAEVPLAGVITNHSGEKRYISGQIDRLLVGKNTILAVDYKTTRTPPTSIDAVPAAYIKQMAAYQLLLTDIYPAKTIRTALIWTSIPLLMDIPAALLTDSLSMGG